MSGAISTAIYVAAAVGAATTLYSANQKKQAAADDREARALQAVKDRSQIDAINATEAAGISRRRNEELAKQKRIQGDTKPKELALGQVDYGAAGSSATTGQATDFLVQKKQSGGLGVASTTNTKRSGLGFSVA